MPINTPKDARKQIAKRMQEGNITIYRLAANMGQDRSNVRKMMEREDIHLSSFIAMVNALGGKLKIEWKDTK